MHIHFKSLTIVFFMPFFIQTAEKIIDKIKTVTIVTPQSTYERSLCNCPWNPVTLTENDLPVSSAPIASEEEFKYVADIQQRVPGAPQAPIILFDTRSKSPHDGDAPGFKGIMYFDATKNIELYTAAMPLQKYKDSEKKFFVGHEIKHLAYRTDVTKNQAINKQQELVMQRGKQEFKALGVGITSIAILASMKDAKAKNQLFIVDSIYKTIIALTVSWYLFNRFKGYYDSKPLHEEELTCDQFAVSTGKTPHEKIAIAKAGKIHIQHEDPWHNFLFTATHPSKYTRFKQFDSMIAEQQEILDSVHLEISPNGFGASITL